MDYDRTHSLCANIVLFREGDMWIAQGLEYDIVTQGTTLEEAKSRFLRCAHARIVDDLLDGNEPLNTCSKPFRHPLGIVQQVFLSVPNIQIRSEGT